MKRCFFLVAQALLLLLPLATAQAKEDRIQALYQKHEKDCVAQGWQKLSMEVDGLPRQLLWKAPEGGWPAGAIIALHGGGGTYSNYCSLFPTGKPMVDFSALALKEGFALFSPDSTGDQTKDPQGNGCGKRWDSLAGLQPHNVDVDFIEKIVTEVIPRLRPKNADTNIYITGISNGGFMTILAASRLGDKITAFAPVSAGDPYGTYLDCSHEAFLRHTPGKFLDSETGKAINQRNACLSPVLLHEKKWPALNNKPSFKMVYHTGDGGVDVSCKEKVSHVLTEQGYSGADAFIIKKGIGKNVFKHLWQSEYNTPIIEFFKGFSGKAH